MRMLVIRFSSLGDCVLLCPFLEHLKRHGAEEVAVVTKRAYAELFTAARGVDRVVALDEHAGRRGMRQVAAACRDRGYLVIDAHSSLRSRVVCAAIGGAAASLRKYYRQRLGLILFKRRRPIPTVSQRYSRLGEEIGLPALETGAGGLRVPGPVRDRVGARLGDEPAPTVTMAPGSRWRSKRWGTEKYLALAQRIVDRYGYRIVLLGDYRDKSDTSLIASVLGENGVDLAGETTILEAAAVIERSLAFVGNDSGLMHLAEAVGVPVLALFGPTVEEFGYYPSLPASRVVERNISCRPCSRNGSRRCPKGTHECLAEIGVEPVEGAFRDLLDGRGPARRVLN